MKDDTSSSKSPGSGDRETMQEVRTARTLRRACEVWGNEDQAAEFMTSPHPELDGDTPIARARSESGARQVEDLLRRLDLGLPV